MQSLHKDIYIYIYIYMDIHVFQGSFTLCDFFWLRRRFFLLQQIEVEVFTLCDCDNITNSYLAHYKQKQIAVAIRKKNAQCE